MLKRRITKRNNKLVNKRRINKKTQRRKLVRKKTLKLKKNRTKKNGGTRMVLPKKYYGKKSGRYGNPPFRCAKHIYI